MFAVGKKVGSGVEQIIYEHFIHVVRTETPSKVLERFRTLFIEGVNYSDSRILATIESLAFERTAEQSFPLIINRCCYIIVNYWQMQPGGHVPVATLVGMLEHLHDVRMTYSRVVRRLRQLLHIYLQSDDYPKLKRLNFVLNGDISTKNTIAERPLGTLINRYPYLYEHSLVSEERTFENVETIKRVQRDLRREQEINLSHYLTYQVRRSRIKAQLGREAADNLPTVVNPTLLSTKELGMAFGHFAGKAEGDATYQDLSRGFVSHLEMQPIVKTFKGDLFDYIVSGVNPSYGKRSFNDRLYKAIYSISPDRDYQRLDEIGLLRVCTHVLNHLVIESPSNPQHFVFMDMINNLGSVFTTGLLLKVVLICQKVKPLLESRLSILFNHYESSQCKGVPWLVKSLENWNVAGAIHFGKVDASALNFLQSIGE
ncbi:hypothetical protein [Chamaesiphon sp. OTE_75_metabat_556]|jgi:hypothetical protein|uniref:hypothetical protein n=1 Tax=Chamaesiphon sp. OTE_75_metabat_556 TaxID=2964692 RepID=UPI00286C0346|nr:hypothetical protein [Chamaesiphon sp. OTE_75_metabat_556]